MRGTHICCRHCIRRRSSIHQPTTHTYRNAVILVPVVKACIPTLRTLEHLTKYCHYCQKHGKSPGRFRFILRDDVDFNYCIIVDIMYISGSPLLHVVDEGTRFQAGRWLENISAKHTWDVLRMCWIDTYLGPPDLITRALLTPKDQYIAQRARGAYIASVCQPEASFDLSFAAQV